jgi:hypothetical protein
MVALQPGCENSEAILKEFAVNLSTIPEQTSKTVTRPLPVTLIALYEFAKAAYILYVFSAIWRLHQASVALGQVGTDPVQKDPFFLLLPIFAIVMLIAGFGLWLLQGWARHMFLFGGALAIPWLPRWLPWLPMNWKMPLGPIVNYGDLDPYLPQAVMMTIFVADVFVYAVLIYYPDVAIAFGQSYGDPYYTGESDDVS